MVRGKSGVECGPTSICETWVARLSRPNLLHNLGTAEVRFALYGISWRTKNKVILRHYFDTMEDNRIILICGFFFSMSEKGRWGNISKSFF
jgi:hypothetical protein